MYQFLAWPIKTSHAPLLVLSHPADQDVDMQSAWKPRVEDGRVFLSEFLGVKSKHKRGDWSVQHSPSLCD